MVASSCSIYNQFIITTYLSRVCVAMSHQFRHHRGCMKKKNNTKNGKGSPKQILFDNLCVETSAKHNIRTINNVA